MANSSSDESTNTNIRANTRTNILRTYANLIKYSTPEKIKKFEEEFMKKKPNQTTKSDDTTQQTTENSVLIQPAPPKEIESQVKQPIKITETESQATRPIKTKQERHDSIARHTATAALDPLFTPYTDIPGTDQQTKNGPGKSILDISAAMRQLKARYNGQKGAFEKRDPLLTDEAKKTKCKNRNKKRPWR